MSLRPGLDVSPGRSASTQLLAPRPHAHLRRSVHVGLAS